MRLSPYYRTRKLVRRSSNPSGYYPSAVAQAYGFVQTQTPALRLGIVSLGGSVAASETNTSLAAQRLPAPKVNLLSVDSARPVSDPGGADVENALDVQVGASVISYCTGQAADIVVAAAPNTGTAIADAIHALVDAGCGVISVSWGAPESQWAGSDRAATEAALQYASSRGVPVCVASGDSSLNDGTSRPTCDYPCGSAWAWAVGGTALTISPNGTWQAESAWGDGRPGDEGGGGGLDTSTAKPAWQTNVVSGSYRGCPDSSANADPATGYRIYVNGQWGVVGGTSAAAPLTAGYLAVLLGQRKALGPANPSGQQLSALLYSAQASAWRDIVTGSDGSPAVAGWDQATGLGSPLGAGLAAALTTSPGGTVTPPSTPTAPTMPGLALATILAAIDAEFAALEAQSSPIVRLLLKQINVALDAALQQKLGTSAKIASHFAWSNILNEIEALAPQELALLAAILKQKGITIPVLGQDFGASAMRPHDTAAAPTAADVDASYAALKQAFAQTAASITAQMATGSALQTAQQNDQQALAAVAANRTAQNQILATLIAQEQSVYGG
jgi:kumamolisin